MAYVSKSLVRKFRTL